MSPDTDAPPAEDEATEAEPEERDEAREALRDSFAAELGDAVVESHIAVGHTLWVRVTPEAWRTAGQVARDHLGCRWFDFLSAIDWMVAPWGRYEDDGLDAAPIPDPTPPEGGWDTGHAGGETRFQVFARVANTTDKHDIVLKVDVGDDLTLPTWVPVYDGADWHERETWEMFGITFAGHPDLRHIYLPTEYEGFPLRKDYPLLARMVKPWPGIVDVEPLPGDDDADEEVGG